MRGVVTAGMVVALEQLDLVDSFDRVYGSISTVVVLMLWFYVVAVILVLGAEVASEYGRSRASGRLRFRGQWRPVPGGLAPVTHLHPEAAPEDEP